MLGASGGTRLDPQVGQRAGVVDQPVQCEAHLSRVLTGGGKVPVDVLKGTLEAVQRRGKLLELGPPDDDIVLVESQLGAADPRLVGTLATALPAVPPRATGTRGCLQRPGAPGTMPLRSRWSPDAGSALAAPPYGTVEVFRHVTILGGYGRCAAELSP